MYSKKRSGPSTEPCGTPKVTGTSDEHSPSNTTAWVQPPKKELIQLRVFPLMPQEESLKSSFKWFTLSKALLKSSKTKSTW